MQIESGYKRQNTQGQNF